MNGVIALPCNLLHYLVLSQHLHQSHSLTAKNLFPVVHDTYWSLLEGLIRINHKLSPIHHESDPGCTSGVWRHGIPCAHSTNSVVAPTDMQPCQPCDTNCHTPTFSAQRVRRLTRARPDFSRSILSHGIVLGFLIVTPSHVECLDLARHLPA